jgi:broad specificity phosphatase PhoE
VKVYLIRHGQSHENAQGLQHRMSQTAFNAFLCDAQRVPLTDLGVQQSYQVACALADLSVERIFTSPFTRALTTATVLGQTLNLAPEVMPDLREIMPGPFATSQRTSPVALLYLRGYLAHPHESWLEVCRRANRVWRDVSREPATSIALVSHYAFIHVLLATAFIKWHRPLRNYHLNNGGITCLETF